MAIAVIGGVLVSTLLALFVVPCAYSLLSVKNTLDGSRLKCILLSVSFTMEDSCMAVSIKDLRYKTKQVLKGLRCGEKPVITFRGHPVARIIPLTSSEKKTFRPVGFGIWKDRSDMKDVARWLDEQRKPRFGR